MKDMGTKREDYIQWLREVKNINIEEISHPQEKKLFEEYIEDYNTCSFPSKKFYNIREWEAKQESKKHKERGIVSDSSHLFMTDEANLMWVLIKYTFITFSWCFTVINEGAFYWQYK